MKTILITGGAGFIGSHLAEKYVKEGHLVKVLDDFSNSRLNNIRGLFNHKNFKLLKGDITDRASVFDAVKGNDVVFHLAAQVHVDKSIIESERTFNVNANGTVNVLEAALRNDIEMVIYASTSEVYGSAVDVPMKETHPLNPASPYAASKAAADRMCYAYHNTYKLPVAIVRNFNTYGDRQADGGAAAVIPLFIRRVLQGLPPIIYGDGLQSRDYMHISDAIEAYNLVMKSFSKVVGEAVNFGYGQDIKILDLANRIIEIAGADDFLEPCHAEERPGEVRQLCADITLARSKIGFEPKCDIETGLERLVEWYRRGEYERWGYA